MKTYHNIHVIGVDHGYGNMKTASCCFGTGIAVYDKEPAFKDNLLVFEGKYYLLGEGHKEFAADKMQDQDYYILTLAAIARELKTKNITSAAVYLAVGLPLTWVSEQKEAFKVYLLQREEVDFIFRDVEYHIRFAGADIFPQGFAAVTERLHEFRDTTMLCDIGNGTMNVMYIADRRPNTQKMYTEKYGTHQCALLIRENMMRFHHTTVDDALINRVLRYGTADMDEAYLETMTATAKQYTEGIFRRLREHEYDPRIMRLFVVGGGGCLIKNFGSYDPKRVVINTDICATAKGYEAMAEMKLRRAGGIH